MSLLRSHDPCMSWARHCLISSLTKTVSIAGAGVAMIASAMSHLIFEFETTYFVLHESFAQPWRRGAFERRLEFREQIINRCRLGNLHGEDILGHDPRRARSAKP